MQIMGELGAVDMQLMSKELTGQKLVEMLNRIVLTRKSDEKAVSLQRDGGGGEIYRIRKYSSQNEQNKT